MKHNTRNHAFCLSLIFLLAVGFSACGGGADEDGDGDIPSITAPTDLTAVINSSSEIVLSWGDNSSNEDGFRVERSTDGTTFSLLANTSANATTHSDAAISGGTTYWYRVRAYVQTYYSGYSNIASATTPWAKSYGESDTERAQSIWHTSDGGFITTGHSVSFGGLWVVKLDSEGAVDWEKSYGGSGSWGERIIQQTSDSGYIVVGSTSDLFTGIDAWILKLDPDGSIDWQKRYGGPSDDDDFPLAIQQTSDGGYIVAGYTGITLDFPFIQMLYDMWAMKLDSSGNIEWQYKYGLNDEDYAYSIQQASDGGYIMAGETISGTTGSDFLVLKLNSDGTIAWQKSYGGSGGDIAKSVVETDSGYSVAGITYSFSVLKSDVWILNLDTDGNVLWEKTYGSAEDEGAQSIRMTTDDGYVAAGYTWSFGASNGDFWVLKLNSDGSAYWQRRYGGLDPDYCYCVQQTDDEGYSAAGLTYSFGAGQCDFWVLKLASDGSIDFDPAGSAAESPTTATVTDTSATVTVTAITPVSTSVTATDTLFTATDTTAIIHQQAPQS